MQPPPPPDLTARHPLAWYERPTLTVARGLLGCLLIHRTADGLAGGRIVETEGYLGPYDLAAHSRGGRQTARNAPMFGPRGHAYVYFIYGMHWCFNVVTGPPDKPQAVLVRALEPSTSLDLMRQRIDSTDSPVHTLCRGPGKLCKTLGITGRHNRADLRGDLLFIVPGRLRRGEGIIASPRVGIAYAGAYTERDWRFSILGNPCVSRAPA